MKKKPEQITGFCLKSLLKHFTEKCSNTKDFKTCFKQKSVIRSVKFFKKQKKTVFFSKLSRDGDGRRVAQRAKDDDSRRTRKVAMVSTCSRHVVCRRGWLQRSRES